ncbi:vacuolar membrane-associated protein iml1 [Linnemannia schmuckeri]|uniref:Vacuolar membrane-associated protein IML1 n=1 Tax=Linnemannia schmuckeri TaxID=64567 RepID=A0A9P5VBR6_9FUNG|nr:vacuolar membrane-associated protein iml1 [Linnemannia schmuckeri]
MFASASNVGAGAPLGSGLARGTSPLQHTTSAGGTNTPSTTYDSPQSSSAATPPLGATKILYVHTDHFSRRDFLIDPAFFPNVQPNDLFEIYDPALPKEAQKKLIIQWTGPDNNTLLKAPVQVSLTHGIAKVFGLSPRQDVIVQRVDPSQNAAKYVELTFRDQYVGRSDMWRLRTSLVGSCVYESKKILYLGCIRAQVKEIYVGNQSVPSGYISSDTRIIFRSESAKYFIFIQMSREMWEFDEDGDIFFERVIFGFLPQLFARWRGKRDGKSELEAPTNHVVSIVLFSRIFYQEEEEARFRIDGYPGDQTGLQRDDEGRYYQDFYKVVIDWEARTDWTTAIIPLKEEVMRYQRDILLRPAGQYSILSGENSFAFEGNVLESINLALNSLDKHYVDRDLQRTGLSIVMITPGSGMFDVDKRLLRLTTERMISGGIGLDMICLSKIPAHIVPLFRWKGPAADSNGLTAMNHGSGHSPSNFSMANNNGGNLMVRSTSNYSRPNSRPPSIKDSSVEARPTTSWTRAFKSSTPSPMPEVQLDMSDPLYYDAPATFPSSLTKTYYMMPHWVDCMFYVSSQRPNTQKFYTRCKMYELQMMGIMEHEISSISIPYLNESYNPQYIIPFGKRLSSSDAHNLRANLSKTVDFDKHDDDLLSDSNSLLAAELKQLKAGSGTANRGMIRDALSLDSIEGSATRNGNNTRRNYDNYVNGGTAHQSISNHHSKMASELSQSLPRAWNTSTIVPPSAIPENPILRDLAGATPSRVSFSLKSANGFLEESRASKQAEYESQGEMNGHRAHQDDPTGEQANYGRTSQHGNIDIKSRSGHIRASTDDDPGFLSSSTVKPIYISRNYRSLQDEAQSELSGADSCNTGSLSSDKGHRTYISNPAGPGGRIIQTRQKSKQTYINPCNPPKTIIRMTSHLRRWQHAFPRVRARSASPNLIRSDVYTDGLSNTEAWRGLMSPASLPLTTDYFPSKEELQDLYSEYIHTISLSEDSGSYGANDQQRRIKAKNLMKELIYHRLAQGFQLIVGSSSSSKIKKSDFTITNGDRNGESDITATHGKVTEQDSAAYEFPSKDADAINRTISTSTPKDKACYLSMGQQVQRLSIDAADGNVEVKRYERRLGYKPENIKYQCVIWAKQLSGYMPRDLTFAYPSLSQYQWNYLDHLVSGYQDELTEELMYWRARFILIPMEHVVTNNLTNVAGEVLDDEEIRLAGFQKFLDLFQRARFVDPDGESSPMSSKKQDISVKVQLITCSFAAWALSELSKKEHENGQSSTSNIPTISESEKLNRNSKIQVIATAIQNPLTGIKLQDRRWHLRVYNSVFLGNEVVDWLIHHFVDIETREEATEFGKKLFDKGLFIHCLGKHHFMDGHYFYQFSGEYAPSGKQTRGWFRNTTQSLTRRDVDLDKLRDKDKDKDADPSSEKLARPPLKLPAVSTGSTTTLGSASGLVNNTTTTGTGATTQTSTNSVPSFRERMEMIQKMAPLKKVDMSKTITIDVDPNKRSERRETAILHYDLAHNIKHCYHFQLHWLGCTARLIEDMLQSWGRTAERCGLRLIEAPIEQDSQGRAFNPFESPVPIKLALRPPPTKGFFKPASSLDPLTEPVQVPKLHFLTELVKSHGFILDMESDELYPPAAQLNYSYKRAPYKNIQYVHRSGVAFIQISYNGPHEFFWVNNRLLTSHSIPAPDRDRGDWDRPKTGGTNNQEGGSGGGGGGGSSSSKNASNHIPNPEVLRRRFTAMCEDKEELAKIWGEISSHLETISGIQDILEDVPDESVVEREGLAWVMPSLAAPRRKSDANLDVAIDGLNMPGEGGSASTDVEGEPPAAPVSVPIIRIDMDPASHEEDQKRAEVEGEIVPEPSSEVETPPAELEQPPKNQVQSTPVDVSSDTMESTIAESVPETTKTEATKPPPEATTETSGQTPTHTETQE